MKQIIVKGLLIACLASMRQDTLRVPLEQLLSVGDSHPFSLDAKTVTIFTPMPRDYTLYSDGQTKIYVVGEAHTDKFPTVPIVNGILEKDRVDVIAVEGIAGLVDNQLKERILEDLRLRAELNKLHDELKIISFSYTTLSSEDLKILNWDNPPFYDSSPGSTIVARLNTNVPIFGYENMQHYL